MRRRHKIFIAAAVCLSLAATGAYFYYMWYPPRFGAVVPGSIYRSKQPTASQLGRLVREKGIRTIVRFRTSSSLASDPTVNEETRFAAQNGLKLFDLVFEDAPPEESVRKLLEILDDETNHPVLLHCNRGVVRTGAAVAVYRMERDGWSPERALSEMLSHGFGGHIYAGSKSLSVLVFVASYRPKHPTPRARSRGHDTQLPARLPQLRRVAPRDWVSAATTRDWLALTSSLVSVRSGAR